MPFSLPVGSIIIKTSTYLADSAALLLRSCGLVWLALARERSGDRAKTQGQV